MINYKFNIEYITSNDFDQADGHSRLISNHKNINEGEILMAYTNAEKEVNAILVNILKSLPITKEEILTSAYRNVHLKKINN